MRQLTVTLPDDIAEMIRRKVDSGEYPSASEVVLVALETLDNESEPMQGPEIEQWLKRDVLPAYDAIEADPSQVATVEEVRASLTGLHEQTLKARGGN